MSLAKKNTKKEKKRKEKKKLVCQMILSLMCLVIEKQKKEGFFINFQCIIRKNEGMFSALFLFVFPLEKRG